MRRLLYTLFIILVLVTVGELGYYLFIRFKGNPAFTLLPVSVSPTLPPTLADSDFKLIYQAPEDKEGRTVIYAGNHLPDYSGIGVQELSPGMWYIVGVFDGWERLLVSSDRLLRLKDPLKDELIKEVRVLFEPYKLSSGKDYITRVRVENLNQTRQRKDIDEAILDDSSFIRLINSFTQPQIAAFFRPGDALVVLPLMERTKSEEIEKRWSVLYDDRGYLIAGSIVLRRYNGARDILDKTTVQ